MDRIVVRPYEPSDQAATWHVRAMTYNSGRPVPIEEQVYKTATPFVGEIDGKIVGTFVIMDMSVTRGPEVAWKCGGIAGVAVLPEARQTGVGAAMMRWALRHMRAHGYHFASLYAFRESYYRKFGYEVAGMRHKITCPNARLVRFKAPLGIRKVNLEEIKGCYEAFARRRAGMNLRTDLHWGRIVGAESTLAVYAAGDPVEAYAIVDHVTKFWDVQPVEEMGWTTQAGYESMLSFFGSLGINKASVTWFEPSDGPFLHRYMDEGATFSMEKQIMYRVVDFPGAISMIPARSDGKFLVEVQDPDVPENTGRWEVGANKGNLSAAPGDGADFTLDPARAAQILLGQPGYASFVRNGELPESSASRLLPELPVYCLDYF